MKTGTWRKSRKIKNGFGRRPSAAAGEHTRWPARNMLGRLTQRLTQRLAGQSLATAGRRELLAGQNRITSPFSRPQETDAVF